MWTDSVREEPIHRLCLQTGSFTDQETGHSDVDWDVLNTVVSSRDILMELQNGLYPESSKCYTS